MITLKVPDMSCGHCVSVITKTLTALDAGASIRVDLPQRLVELETTASPDAVRGALEEAGYPAAAPG